MDRCSDMARCYVRLLFMQLVTIYAFTFCKWNHTDSRGRFSFSPFSGGSLTIICIHVVDSLIDGPLITTYGHDQVAYRVGDTSLGDGVVCPMEVNEKLTRQSNHSLIYIE